MLFRPKSEEILANTRNIEASFLNFKKMNMANVLLTEIGEEQKNYLDWPVFAYAGGLGYPVGAPPPSLPPLEKMKKMSPTQM